MVTAHRRRGAEIDAARLRDRIEGILERRPTIGFAVAVVVDGHPTRVHNDTLGPLRWPACCGVGALKPTLGRVSHASTIEPAEAPIGVQLTGVKGPVARRVSDLRSAFEVMAGSTWRDPWTVPAPLRGPEPERPIRAAVVVDPVGQGVAEQVRAGVRTAAGILTNAGYVVDEVEPPSIDTAAKALLSMLNTPEVRAGWSLMSALAPPDTVRFMASFFAVARDPDLAATVQSFMVRQSLLRVWGEVLEVFPVVNLIGTVALAVGAVSYAGTFGVRPPTRTPIPTSMCSQPPSGMNCRHSQRRR